MERVIFNCSGEYFTSAKWTKDGLWLSSDRFMTTATSGEAVLTIDSVEKSDEGIYYCNVTNHVINVTTSMRFGLTVLGDLLVGFVTSPQIGFQGDWVELKCNASGLPTPRVHWSHLVSGGCGGGKRVSTEPDGRMVIQSLSVELIGEFECIANNSLLVDQKSTNVSIFDGKYGNVCEASPCTIPSVPVWFTCCTTVYHFLTWSWF